MKKSVFFIKKTKLHLKHLRLDKLLAIPFSSWRTKKISAVRCGASHPLPLMIPTWMKTALPKPTLDERIETEQISQNLIWFADLVGGFFHHPFQKYAQIILDHFPMDRGEKILFADIWPPEKPLLLSIAPWLSNDGILIIVECNPHSYWVELNPQPIP